MKTIRIPATLSFAEIVRLYEEAIGRKLTTTKVKDVKSNKKGRHE